MYIMQRYRAGVTVISEACSVLSFTIVYINVIESCLWAFVTIPIIFFKFACLILLLHNVSTSMHAHKKCRQVSNLECMHMY